MFTAEKLQPLVDSLVIPDRKSAPGNVDREATIRTLSTILQGGRENIVGLVDMLVEPGKGDDSRARYALHALIVHVAGLRDETQRRALAESLAATLQGDRPLDARRFVVKQLQLIGGKEVTAALGKLLVEEQLAEEAAQALLAIRAGAAEQFRAALPKANGKARLVVVHGAGTLRDPELAKALRELAGDRDRDVRLTALWALANIGDPESVGLFIKAADGEGYERTKAAGACLLLAERLAASGNKGAAGRVLNHLRDTRTDASESHFKEAATRALSALK